MVTKKLKISDLGLKAFSYSITGSIILLILLRLLFQRIKLVFQVSSKQLREGAYLTFKIFENNNIKKKLLSKFQRSYN